MKRSQFCILIGTLWSIALFLQHSKIEMVTCSLVASGWLLAGLFSDDE